MSEVIKLNYNVANDNGNSKVAMVITNGDKEDVIIQPNIYSMDEPVIKTFSEPETYIPNILDTLWVNINSPVVQSSNASLYVGKNAYSSSSIHGLKIKGDKKYEQELPLISTLSILAGYAVKDAYEKTKKVPTTIKLNIEMSTNLPVMEWNNESQKIYTERFTNNTHTVQVNLGTHVVTVTIKFDFVTCIPESLAANYAVVLDSKGDYRNDSIFDEVKKQYKISDFTGKNIFTAKQNLMIDIGDGTTDLGATTGYTPNLKHSDGEKYGVGHAISNALKPFSTRANLKRVARQKFMEYVQDPTNKYHEDAIDELKKASRDQILKISDFVSEHLDDMDNEADHLIVFGGGSIQLKDGLYDNLLKIAEKSRSKLVWVDKKHAVTLNAHGLNNYMKLYHESLKKKQKATVKN